MKNDAKNIKVPGRKSTLYDLLDQSTVDRLYDLVTDPKAKRKSAGSFSLPDFRVNIPLEPVFGKTEVKVLKIAPKCRNAKQIYLALLWTAIYGSKRLSMVHWYLLYTLFEKRIETKDKETLALLRILRITTERSGSAFNQKLRPVKTVVQNVLGKDVGLLYCKYLEQSLGVKLPQEDPKLNDLIRVTYGVKFQHRPKEPARIGVGYKDKGTLPKGPKEDTSEAEDYLVRVGDYFADLLHDTRETEMLAHYDPQKHQKMLQLLTSELKKKVKND